MKLIVAVDRNWAIGKDGGQPAYLKEDLKRFRALTLGRCVVMGRKTLAALPGGRPLAGRRNLVLSAGTDRFPEGAEVCRSIGELLAKAPKDAFVIGGASVYRALLPWCDTAYVTKLDASFSADRWFPDLDGLPEWRAGTPSPPLEQDGIFYRFITYTKKL